MVQSVNEPCYDLKLYVAGHSPRSLLAIDNFETLCRGCLKGRCTAEVIDILQDPKMAGSAQVVATPTLVKHSPGKLGRLVGTLSETDKVLAALDLKPNREEKSN